MRFPLIGGIVSFALSDRAFKAVVGVGEIVFADALSFSEKVFYLFPSMHG